MVCFHKLLYNSVPVFVGLKQPWEEKLAHLIISVLLMEKVMLVGTSFGKMTIYSNTCGQNVEPEFGFVDLNSCSLPNNVCYSIDLNNLLFDKYYECCLQSTKF